MLRTRFTLIALALLALVTTTCAKDDPTGVEFEAGTVSAAVHDSASVLPASRTVAWPADSMAYDGTLSGSAQVHIYSEANGWVALGGPASVSFEIFCLEDAIVTANADVPLGAYTQVRLTLSGFVANVIGGATLDGVVVGDARVIALGGPGAEIVIERTVTSFTVTESVATLLAFDLNTDTWIDATVADLGVIDAAQVQAGAVVYVSH